MARSRARIRHDSLALDRLKLIIDRAVEICGERAQAGVVSEFIRGSPKFFGEITGDRQILSLIVGEALQVLLRKRYLSWGQGAGDSATPPQLSLFPSDERKIVRRVGKARIWIPSLDAHVQYHPGADITPRQLREAAKYYANLSGGLKRTADALRDLARLREKASVASVHPRAAAKAV